MLAWICSHEEFAGGHSPQAASPRESALLSIILHQTIFCTRWSFAKKDLLHKPIFCQKGILCNGRTFVILTLLIFSFRVFLVQLLCYISCVWTDSWNFQLILMLSLSSRSNTQRIEIKIWPSLTPPPTAHPSSHHHQSILRFSRVVLDFGPPTTSRSLNSPRKECPISLQIRHRGSSQGCLATPISTPSLIEGY